LKKIWDGIIYLNKLLVIFFVSMMLILVSVNVFCRYVLHNSIGWAFELSRYLFIYVALLAAALAYKDNEHIACEILINRIPNDYRKVILSLIKNIGIFVTLLFLLKNGWVVYTSTTNISPLLSIPLKFVYVVLPVSVVLMLILNLNFILKDLMNFKKITNRSNKGSVDI
jgi:TRAP-type C4-dicarboxylate transport system permease small subunit